MRTTFRAALAGLLVAMLSALTMGSVSSPAHSADTSAASSSARSCTWYVYKARKDTTYWENRWGSAVNRGFWQHPSKGTRMLTNQPFRGKSRTPIKYQIWNKKWQKLSVTNKFPYINRGAVRYQYCY